MLLCIHCQHISTSAPADPTVLTRVVGTVRVMSRCLQSVLLRVTYLFACNLFWRSGVNPCGDGDVAFYSSAHSQYFNRYLTTNLPGIRALTFEKALEMCDM